MTGNLIQVKSYLELQRVPVRHLQSNFNFNSFPMWSVAFELTVTTWNDSIQNLTKIV